MFKSIKRTLDYVHVAGSLIARQSYQIIDSEFESDVCRVDIVDGAAFVRMLICEYSTRNLNVAANLKLFYEKEFTRKSTYKPLYKEALIKLATHRNIMSAYYDHLNFDNYYACLKRHLKRMAFVGKLK